MYRYNENAFKIMEKYETNHAMQFDVVVKYRIDIVSHMALTIPGPMDPTTVYIPAGSDHEGLNDQVALGSRNAMKIYCACSSNILNLCQSGCLYHPESLILRHLQTNAINIVRFPYSYFFAR